MFYICREDIFFYNGVKNIKTYTKGKKYEVSEKHKTYIILYDDICGSSAFNINPSGIFSYNLEDKFYTIEELRDSIIDEII